MMAKWVKNKETGVEFEIESKDLIDYLTKDEKYVEVDKNPAESILETDENAESTENEELPLTPEQMKKALDDKYNKEELYEYVTGELEIEINKSAKKGEMLDAAVEKLTE